MASLPLTTLVSPTGLYHETLLPQDILLLMGKNLSLWLGDVLDSLSVGETPFIQGEASSAAYIEGRVYIAEGAKVEPTAMIVGPAFIGPGSEVRHGAYLRGEVYVGKDCVLGHATEAKSAVFLDGAKAGHFAYVGNSVLGREVNLGAGTKLANLKLSGKEVRFRDPRDMQVCSSEMRKFGALLGDRAQTGCNAVLSPGTILGPGALVLPCEHFHGTKLA